MDKLIVNVHLKKELLDPQGKAILNKLNQLGLNELLEVRQGKQFVLTLDREITAEISAKIEELSQTLLSNPVIENYSIEVKNES